MLETSHLKTARIKKVEKAQPGIKKPKNAQLVDLHSILAENGDINVLVKVGQIEREKWAKIHEPFERLANEVKVAFVCACTWRRACAFV